MLPSHVGRYEIKSEIGRGGMATVYHAHDPRFKRDVAVKVLPPQFLHDPTFRARFEREAEIVASLEHPAIVPVYDFGEEDGLPYIVMRFMSGGTLAEMLKQGPLPLSEAARILSRLAPALDEAHARGIIHRDLKPSNILFDQYGEAYLTDFGIARISEATTALTGSAIVGTPAYMSPEQARGDADIDGRSDIYALGAIVFEMLTGKQPYEAQTPMAVVLKHLTEPVPRIQELNSDLPPDTQELIAKAMAKERDQRFATAGELAAIHEQIAKQAGSTPAPQAVLHPGTAKPSASAAASSPGLTAKPKTEPPAPAINASARIVGSAPGLPKGKPRRVLLTWVWLAGGLVAVAGLCGLVGLLLAGRNLLFGPATPTSEPAPEITPTSPLLITTSPTGIANADLFRDDFSDPSSGWGHFAEAGNKADYEAGAYRIYVDKPHTIVWSNPSRTFADISIQVNADKIAGADDNYFGVICRYQDEDNFYLLAISSDGFYTIGKYKNGEFITINQDGVGYSAAIHQGKTRNQLRADCLGDTLTLYVNDTRVAQVEDNDFASGDVGLIAAALDVRGTNILFDDFIAQKPK